MSDRWKLISWAIVVAACVAATVWDRTASGADLAQAPAGPPCAPFDQAAGFLGKTYGETMTEYGLTNDQTRLVALFVSPAGTFTVLEISAATGRACIKFAGQGWGAADRATPPAATAPPVIERPKR